MALYYDDMSDSTMYQKMPKSIPPKIGEYAYFDSRLFSDINSYQNVKISKHCLIGTFNPNEGTRLPYGCHFSSTWQHYFTKLPVTNHGVIARLKLHPSYECSRATAKT
jgi:hypothetical protein